MRIALLGDIAMFGNFSVNSNPNLIEGLREISDYLSGFDHVIGNLETPFTAKRKPHGAKSAYLGSDPANVEVLKALHVSAVNLANNHMADFGHEGIATTKRLLDENGIPWFGLDGKDYILEDGDSKIAFNGFCCHSTNPIKLSSRMGRKGVNRLNYPEMLNLLKSNSSKGRLNIFAVHSGIEHVSSPSLEQIRLARKLAEDAPYVWYGHHPHVVQGIDLYNGAVIAHSLGNFSSSEYEGDNLCPKIELTEDNRIGLILELKIENNKIKEYKAVFTRLNENGSISLLKDEGLAEKYSEMLKEAFSHPESYEKKRREQRSLYLARRREMRNLSWVMRRLRPRYFRLYIDYRNNARHFHQNVKKHL